MKNLTLRQKLRIIIVLIYMAISILILIYVFTSSDLESKPFFLVLVKIYVVGLIPIGVATLVALSRPK